MSQVENASRKQRSSLASKVARASWELFVAVGCPAIGAAGFFALSKGMGWY